MSETSGRFRGGTIKESDYNLYPQPEIKDLQQRWANFRRRALIFVLSVIFGFSVFLWVGDGISTVAALWSLFNLPVWAGIIAHILISAFQKYLLDFKGILERVFGRGSAVSNMTSRIIYLTVATFTFINLGTTALGVPYIGLVPSTVAVLLSCVISNAELIAVFCWIGLGWIRENT
jgi:hypothetical protein